MPCYSPIRAWRSRSVGPNGKRQMVFNRRYGLEDQEIPLPCGQCVGCRLERSRQWAVRIKHETTLHTDNAFITLTYDEAHVPDDYSLRPKHFTDFMKRYRKWVDIPIRYFMCGEYGDLNQRPHYHAIIFGHDFEDKKRYSEKNGNLIYESKTLDKLWTHGECKIGSVTFESAAYVARYVMKKRTGKDADDHYERFNPATGEVYWIEPEYCRMSRRPGIGKGWMDKYGDETYTHDSVIINGKETKPPRYYDQQREEEEMEKIKAARKKGVQQHAWNQTLARLRVREDVKLAQTKMLRREL